MDYSDYKQDEAPPESGYRSGRTFPAVFVALGVVAVLFGLYEAVERMWLDDLDMSVLHTLHLARGVLAALLAASVVAWLLLREAPPTLTKVASDSSPPCRLPSETERITVCAWWFIRMRWVAIIVATLLVLHAVGVAGLLPPEVGPPLVLILLALTASNLAYTAMLRNGRGIAIVLPLQVHGDLVLLAALIHFSGGIENPLSLLTILHVILGGILLHRGQAWLVAVNASASIAIVGLGESIGSLEHYTLTSFPHFQHGEGLHHAAYDPSYVLARLGLQAGAHFVIAYFVTTLVDRLREDERELVAATDRAVAERQLLEQALETTRTGLRVRDPDHGSLWANGQWARWFGSLFADPPEPEVERTSVAEGAASARPGVRVHEFTLPDTKASPEAPSTPVPERTFQLTTAPLDDGRGGSGTTVELVQEVTEQKRAQAQLLQASRLAAIGEMAGHVAHEINNPIAIIGAKARLLLRDRGDVSSGESATELGKIAELSDRIARIASGLLSSCRPSAATRRTLDARIPLGKARRLVEDTGRSRGVDIQYDVASSSLPVRANEGELEQVFLNLLLNALDAMPNGGRLRLSGYEMTSPATLGEHHNVVVVVEDTGPGIPREDQGRIFEPFFSKKGDGKGTGLGLAICRGIVRSHGGEITVTSTPGNGAHFTVTLPLDREGGQGPWLSAS